jgi:hypothetical protein
MMNKFFLILILLLEVTICWGGPIYVKKGYSETSSRGIYPDENGIFTIELKELERLEVHLCKFTTTLASFTGGMVVGNRSKSLPTGSTLDRSGIFYWIPGPGFIGRYKFLFESPKTGEEFFLMVTIKPKAGVFSRLSNNCAKLSARSGTKSEPFGYFDTPVDGSTISSSIPVTGWALDDIGVESVKIYREQGKKLIFIGDAIFVEGARPDVAAAYPGYPNNTKAGWGYMMLTNLLPNNGNGIFTLHAIATDSEGNTSTLGTKTITVDNANAIKPFGAIDTPTQGGTATGNSFINWGWVLTPQPNQIPTDGSTINVFVDGLNLGNPVYNIYRADIANLFPSYANSDGAVGYFLLDTTAFSNNVHTISWVARDNAGNIDGIGHRYFTVYNEISEATTYTNPTDFDAATGSLGVPTVIDFEDIDATPVNNTYIGREEFDGNFYAEMGITFSNPNGYPFYISPGGLYWNESNSLSVGRFPFDDPPWIFHEDDDLVVTFSKPCMAVGLTLIDNFTYFEDEYIQFIDANGNLIKQVALPLDFTYSRAFIGIVSIDRPVAKINIVETPDDGDDINYDDFIFFNK